jgi:phosphoribosylformimino-5-aminoimidazole carboxamide ribotide isomerase
VAAHWRDQGARRLHLVDLNGAFAGKPKNLNVIRSILQEVGDDMPVQLGGGIRDWTPSKNTSTWACPTSSSGRRR